MLVEFYKGDNETTVSGERMRRAISRAAHGAKVYSDPDVRVAIANTRDVYRMALGDVHHAVERAFMEGVRRGYVSAGLDPSLALFDPTEVRWITERAVRLTADMAMEQRRVLARMARVADSVGVVGERRALLLREAAGLSERQAESLVRQYRIMLAKDMPERTVYARIKQRAHRARMARARAFGVTESQIAMNVGKEQLWRVARSQGYLRLAMRMWITSLLENVCKICRPMHGQLAALDAPFYTPTGESVYTPGMTHTYCQCTEELQQ